MLKGAVQWKLLEGDRVGDLLEGTVERLNNTKSYEFKYALKVHTLRAMLQGHTSDKGWKVYLYAATYMNTKVHAAAAISLPAVLVSPGGGLDCGTGDD